MLSALVAAVLLAWVIWESTAGFSGGHLPIFGWRIKATVAHGFEVLIAFGGIAFAVAVALIILIERIAPTKNAN